MPTQISDEEEGTLTSVVGFPGLLLALMFLLVRDYKTVGWQTFT